MSVQQRQGLLAKLAKEFVRLPGIGQKTSQRLAFHMMKINKDEALRLADAIRDVKEFVVFCEQCRNIAES
ncbi:MAG: recombination protein RecR, partial [Nitrospira sp. SB0678_bin_10]|nr:recombination protein RecR [Nitrospira sp. SB0678_bin_10]